MNRSFMYNQVNRKITFQCKCWKKLREGLMMNEGMLSQEEIDALLKIGAGDEEELDAKDVHDIHVEDYLSTIEIDTLGEIGNISFGSSATTLSTLLRSEERRVGKACRTR